MIRSSKSSRPMDGAPAPVEDRRLPEPRGAAFIGLVAAPLMGAPARAETCGYPIFTGRKSEIC